MSRRGNTTKNEIIALATKLFLENGYSNTSPRTICDELNLSTGNLTYYFPTKEHLLAELIKMLCDFQWKVMEKGSNKGMSSVMSLCMELMAMAVMSEEDEKAKDLFLSAYSSPLCIEIIRKNDAERAKLVFADYCSDWTDENFMEAEILVSGIEYATLMTAGTPVSLETRIEGALGSILSIYEVPKEIKEEKIKKIFNTDCGIMGLGVLKDFKQFVAETNEKTTNELIKKPMKI